MAFQAQKRLAGARVSGLLDAMLATIMSCMPHPLVCALLGTECFGVKLELDVILFCAPALCWLLSVQEFGQQQAACVS